MKFSPAPTLPDVLLISREPFQDERGYFERFFCEKELESAGVSFRAVQANFSFNLKKGVLRGLHYQADPSPEGKIIWCERGKIFDVAVNMRAGSPNFGKWAAFDLSEEDHRMVYIPAGYAHGFQALADDSKVGYLMSEYYVKGGERGIRWDDPTLGIPWPIAEPVILARDRSYPLLKDL